MKRIILLFHILTISLLFASCNSNKKAEPLVQQGNINLSDWDLEKDGIIKLDGDWEFYWNKLYTPEEINNDSFIKQKSFCEVPGVWSKQKFFPDKLPGEGFGTYHLKVKLNQKYDVLGIKILDFSSSYKLWINNEPVASNGIVSANLNEVEHQILPQIKCFKAHGDSLDIVVQVANFFHHDGGMWKSVRIGTLDQIIANREKRL